MPGREFLELAREVLGLATLPRHWRAVVVHAYYALLLECRDAMTRWGLPPLSRQQVLQTKPVARERVVATTQRL
jgi:hypothetical protein